MSPVFALDRRRITAWLCLVILLLFALHPQGVAQERAVAVLTLVWIFFALPAAAFLRFTPLAAAVQTLALLGLAAFRAPPRLIVLG